MMPTPPNRIPPPLSPVSALPNYSVISQNINSLSQYAITATGHARRRNIHKNIKHYSQQAQVICLQESHLRPYERSALKHILPNWFVQYNNEVPPTTTAPSTRTARNGVLTALSPAIISRYTPFVVPIPTDSTDIAGHVTIINLTPKTANSLPITYINAYLSSRSRSARLSQLQYILANVDPATHTVLCGDFNFIESPDDGSMTAHHLLNTAEQNSWEALLSKGNLVEVSQPTHTYFRFSQTTDTDLVSSRLDRFYVTHRPADFLVASPTAFIPNSPFNSLRLHRARNTTTPALARYQASPDHYPIALSFVSTATTGRRAPNVPQWLFASPLFCSEVQAAWDRSPPLNSFVAAEYFKTCIKQVARNVTHYKQTASSSNQIRVLSAAVALLRAITTNRHTSYMDALISRHSELEQCRIKDTSIVSYDLTSALITKLLMVPELTNATKLSSPPTVPTSHTTNMISFIKAQLPTDRRRLTHLIPYDIDDEIRDEDEPLHLHTLPVTEPVQMANMLARYWGKLWCPRNAQPSAETLATYLQNYTARVPNSHSPSFPNRSHQQVCPALDASWTELVHASIATSGDSSTGPDGIPFRAYRVFSHISTTFILDCIIDSASGIAPPIGFNIGRGYFIPKDDTFKPLSTRPIVVNNSENRLLASTIAAAITPAAQLIIHPSQKGFVEGRLGSDNIFDLTELYYSHLQQQRQLYTLQIDTRKAFDSIDHPFIFALLHHIGLPPWFALVVRFLLTNVFVSPVVSAHTNVLIPIGRGVKQGCPLSPLLFVLAYDPLLWRIDALRHPENGDDPIDLTDPTPFAFADDLAISSNSLTTIFTIMLLVNEFTTYSGLGVNEDKSRLAFTLPLSRAELAAIAASPWPRVVTTPTFTYLGVLIGRGVSTVDVFASTLRKLKTRARLYSPIIKSLPLHLRVTAVNVFLVSLFSYLIQFYLPGNEVVSHYHSIVRHLLIPFRATAFSLFHLFTSPRSSQYGLLTPVKDLWAVSIVTLANKFDLASFHGTTSTSIPNFPHLDSMRWNSMRISDHIAASARDLMNHYLRAPDNTIDTAAITMNNRDSRRTLYHKAIFHDTNHLITHPTAKGSLVQRLQRWGLGTPEDARRLTSRWCSMKHSLPPHYYTHHLLMIFWALPTAERIHACKTIVHSDPRDPPSYFSCFLCGFVALHAPADSLHHLYSGECPVASATRLHFFKRLQLPIPTTFSISHSLLVAPSPSPSLTKTRALHFNATLFFNLHLYSLRARLFKPLPHPPPLPTAINTLSTALVTEWNCSNWRKRLYNPISSSSHMVPRHFSTRPKSHPTMPPPQPHLPNAPLPPSESLTIYTDGSADPNPGPSGAGLVLFRDGALVESHSIPLGHGTNNTGELYAVGAALQRIEEILDSPPHPVYTHPTTARILTDSTFARGVTTLNWELSKNSRLQPLLKSVKARWRKVADRLTLHVDWVEAHTGIAGNELADVEAGKASAASTPADSANLTRGYTGLFIYQPP